MKRGMLIFGQKVNRALASKSKPLPSTWHGPAAQFRRGTWLVPLTGSHLFSTYPLLGMSG